MAIKSGWLYKTPPNISGRFLRWKKRHFDLWDNGDLAYSKSSTHTTVLGLIRLGEVERVEDAEETVSCMFSIGLYSPVSKKMQYLRAENRADIDAWCMALQKYIPNYQHLPVDARPVYKALPEAVAESLPSRAGFLLPSQLELFSREKFCEITEGQFRIYANQSREHLDLSYSLLPCKGVEELTDHSKRANAFQFKIEFMNQERAPLVLSAKTPFERQGWIVCLMKTITILSKFQSSYVEPSMACADSQRPRSISVPVGVLQLSREHLELHLTDLMEDLVIRDNWVSELRDDKVLLNKKMVNLTHENEHLRRHMTDSRPPGCLLPRGRDHDNLDEYPTRPGASPITGSKLLIRPSTLPTGQFLVTNLFDKERPESRSSSSSGDSSFRDCSSSVSQPKAPNGFREVAAPPPDLISDASAADSLLAQLTALCRELGCLRGEEPADPVASVRRHVEGLQTQARNSKLKKDENTLILEEHIRGQDTAITALRNQTAVHNEGMEKLKLQENCKRQEEVEALLGQHRSEMNTSRQDLVAMREMNTALLSGNRKQLEERETETAQEREQVKTEFDRMSADKTKEIDVLKRLLNEVETENAQLKAQLPRVPPPKPPLPPK